MAAPNSIKLEFKEENLAPRRKNTSNKCLSTSQGTVEGHIIQLNTSIKRLPTTQGIMEGQINPKRIRPEFKRTTDKDPKMREWRKNYWTMESHQSLQPSGIKGQIEITPEANTLSPKTTIINKRDDDPAVHRKWTTMYDLNPPAPNPWWKYCDQQNTNYARRKCMKESMEGKEFIRGQNPQELLWQNALSLMRPIKRLRESSRETMYPKVANGWKEIQLPLWQRQKVMSMRKTDRYTHSGFGRDINDSGHETLPEETNLPVQCTPAQMPRWTHSDRKTTIHEDVPEKRWGRKVNKTFRLSTAGNAGFSLGRKNNTQEVMTSAWHEKMVADTHSQREIPEGPRSILGHCEIPWRVTTKLLVEKTVADTQQRRELTEWFRSPVRFRERTVHDIHNQDVSDRNRLNTQNHYLQVGTDGHVLPSQLRTSSIDNIELRAGHKIEEVKNYLRPKKVEKWRQMVKAKSISRLSRKTVEVNQPLLCMMLRIRPDTDSETDNENELGEPATEKEIENENGISLFFENWKRKAKAHDGQHLAAKNLGIVKSNPGT